MRIPKKKYHEYINSDLWWQKREEVFNFKWRKCEKCWIEHSLQIHHWTYVRLWNELLEDLFVLCNSCHFELHELCWLKDLLRVTKRFIAWLPYEKRSSNVINTARWKEAKQERKRVRREKNKRKNERRKANMPIKQEEKEADFSLLQKNYAIFEPVNNSYWFDFREFYLIDWKVKNMKIIKIPKWIIKTDYKTYKPAIHCTKSEFRSQFSNL